MTVDPAKLAGFPPIFWINRDVDADRRATMEAQFEAWKLPATRVPALDGDGPMNFIEGEPPACVPPRLVACCASHLKAMSALLDTDAPSAVIMEDDCSLDSVPFWPFDWRWV